MNYDIGIYYNNPNIRIPINNPVLEIKINDNIIILDLVKILQNICYCYILLFTLILPIINCTSTYVLKEFMIIIFYQILYMTYYKTFSLKILKLAILFNFCWIICGSILYCQNYINNQLTINDFMNMTCIMNYILLMINLHNHSNNKFVILNILFDMTLLLIN
jgi:hypothetical protein